MPSPEKVSDQLLILASQEADSFEVMATSLVQEKLASNEIGEDRLIWIEESQEWQEVGEFIRSGHKLPTKIRKESAPLATSKLAEARRTRAHRARPQVGPRPAANGNGNGIGAGCDTVAPMPAHHHFALVLSCITGVCLMSLLGAMCYVSMYVVAPAVDDVGRSFSPPVRVSGHLEYHASPRTLELSMPAEKMRMNIDQFGKLMLALSNATGSHPVTGMSYHAIVFRQGNARRYLLPGNTWMHVAETGGIGPVGAINMLASELFDPQGRPIHSSESVDPFAAEEPTRLASEFYYTFCERP